METFEGQKVVGKSQNGFLKNSSLSNMIAFSKEIIGLLGKEKAVYVIYLDFNKAFRIVPCNIFVDKLMKYALQKGEAKWTENCLKHWFQRPVVSNIKISWRPVSCVVPSVPVLFKTIQNYFDAIKYTLSKFTDDNQQGRVVDRGFSSWLPFERNSTICRMD